MKRSSLVVLLVLFASPVLAQEPVFVETADQMVEQMLGSQQPVEKFGKTRSFVIGEEPQQKTRSIKITRNDDEGIKETMVVQVPESGIDPAARLKIEFDINSATLRPSAFKLLGELAKALQNEKVVDHNVCVKGHTDDDGDDEYNLELSFDRANSVKSYLLGAHNVPSERLEIFGYGEAMPLVTNSTSGNKQANRRVEVSLDCQEIKH